MLLREYTFETMLPECNTFAETINAVATLSDDVSKVFPYLASLIKQCGYDDNSKILTFKLEGKGIAMYPRRLRSPNSVTEKKPPRCWTSSKTSLTELMRTDRILSPATRRVSNSSTWMCSSSCRERTVGNAVSPLALPLPPCWCVRRQA